MEMETRRPHRGLLKEELSIRGDGAACPFYRVIESRLRIPSPLALRLLRLAWRRRVFWSGGIVLRVGRSHLRAHFLAPRVQPSAELFDFLRLRGREVTLLADVLADVVEFDLHVVEELDEFEVARANRAVGHRAAKLIVLVVRIMPVEVA